MPKVKVVLDILDDIWKLVRQNTGHKTQLSRYGFGSSGITSFKYSQQNMREGLARYIVATEQPLTFAEDERLINFLQKYV